MFIGDYLGRRCVYSANSEAIISYDKDIVKRYSYQDLNNRANKVAEWLLKQEIKKGDRVGIIAYDGIHFYDLFFACSKIGAIFTPFNWRLHPKEIFELCLKTEPKIIFYSQDDAPFEIAEFLINKNNGIQFIPIHGEKQSLKSILAIEKINEVVCENITENDTVALLFTGGTTGLPKAAEISHKQVVWNTMNNLLGDITGRDKYLNVFPLFHAGGLFGFTIPMLILGGSIVQMDHFSPEKTLETIDNENVTIFAGVPTMFEMISNSTEWDKSDLSTLRFCFSGGAPLPLSLIHKFQMEKNIIFRQGFGMTEFGPGVFSLSSTDSNRKTGSIGKPNYFVDAKIIKETGESVSPNQTGELVLRGPSCMKGYFREPDATNDVFDEDGYFHTGDSAYQDDEGYFYIAGRLKDMFISGGENIYPLEIENILDLHPAISLCSVIGVSDEKWGDVGHGFVTLKPNKTINEEELIEYLKQNLAKFKVPKRITILDEMPFSGAGKILKSELRKLV